MFVSRTTTAIMFMAASFTASAFAGTRLKIASVPSEYRPSTGIEEREQVSMQSFSFDVDKETSRVRIIVDYTYPDQMAFGADGGIGPAPTETQVPGLNYSKDDRTVVFSQGDRKVVCATISQHHFLFWDHSSAKPTGACIVTTKNATHQHDTGWNIQKVHTVDTYFEIK